MTQDPPQSTLQDTSSDEVQTPLKEEVPANIPLSPSDDEKITEGAVETEKSPELQSEETSSEKRSPKKKKTPEKSSAEEKDFVEKLKTKAGVRKVSGRQDPSQGKNWYAIHTYSGYEDAVEKALRLRIDTLGMQDKIFDVLIPKEKEIVMRRGKPVEVKKCLFPGYVLVEMIVTDDSWYVVRNTPNVTGFVGSGNIPVPVTLEEFSLVKSRMGSEEPKFKADFKRGDVIKIISGPFATFEGNIDSVDTEKGKLTVLVSIFDRETPVELDFNQVAKK
ncbi:transcription termination/antitermination factor NusG [Candidatus Peregrinibacteria bacterium]|nr:transcription termination/antitermination factor NusG [Candidatus Peregrinibacteria bacterium]